LSGTRFTKYSVSPHCQSLHLSYHFKSFRWYTSLVPVLDSWKKAFQEQEAFEKCLAHLPLRAAARRIAIHMHSPGVTTVARHHCRTPPAHRCPRRQRQQRQRVTARGDRYGPIEWAQR